MLGKLSVAQLLQICQKKFGRAPAVTAVPKNMGALSKLVMRQNDIHGAEAGKAFSRMLAQNTVLKELDLSSQQVDKHSGNALDVAFAKEFAVGIRDNRAMLKFTFSGDNYHSKPVTMETSMTEADFSRKGLGISGAIMLSAFLPKCT
jgi:hypothetical protein